MDKAATQSGSRISVQDLRAFCLEAMRRSGLNEADAGLTADVLVTTDMMGTFTHGTRQLRGLLKNVRSGRINPRAREEIVGDGLAWVMVEAHDAMPPAVSCRSMELAIQKAKVCGLGYVGVKGSSHFGAAGYYANLAAKQDLIGLSMCNVDICMTVPGARAKVLGTNPIAYAVPAGDERPVCLDIATSTVAATKVFAASARGESIPDNWLVDDEGIPTTDPRLYPEQGALLPMAGHKGYGLAVLVEILSGVLTGAAIASQIQSWVLDVPDRTNQGHAFLAIDIAQMMPLVDFKARMDGLIREIKSAPKTSDAERIYLPGEMEWERHDAAVTEDILLPSDVVANLRGLAEDVGMDASSLFPAEG
ncbi:MAG: Ldh family oxidoreductase [Candidatus Poribacteria bacterium]|nr:Ldh family oxidoreductase [Candidatus Poribacteria bacterium]